MNPALMALYLDKNGNFNQQGYNNNLMNQYYQSMGIEPPQPSADMSWLQDYNEVPVPGTRGAVAAPQLPKPQPIQEKLSPEEEYAKYGTIHGITPDPNSNYDMAETSPAPPGSEGNPIQRGAQTAQQTARASSAIDDDQRKRALGVAMVKFFSNYAGSQNPSRLGALNEAFNPAIDAFISERNHYENAAAKLREQQLDEEYKRGMLDIHKQELGLKKGKAQGVNLTDYQYQQIRNGLITRAATIDDKESAAIDRATKNLRPSNPKHAEIIRTKTEEIKKRFDRQRKVLTDEAKHFNIDLGLEPEDELVETINPSATPDTEASIEELKAKLAALKAQGR
jgi:hypothetical protein